MKTTILIGGLFLIGSSAFAQNEMINLPNGSSGISSTTSGNGVAIGPGFTDPEARLHIRTDATGGSCFIIDAEDQLVSTVGGQDFYEAPDYFLKAQIKNNGIQPATYSSKFSVDINGKIQSGFFSPSVPDQLAVRNNIGIFASVDRNMRFDLTNGAATVFWESPGDNFQIVNADNSTVALQLGEDGEVGVNTGTWTNDHKLHVSGSTISDEIWVQKTNDWNSGDDYMGLEFTDRPEVRWAASTDTSYFEFKSEDTGEIPLRLTSSGKVGINTDNFVGDYNLYIAGSSVAEEMFVKLSNDWGDFVFEKEYDLMPLDELEIYLEENKHLPEFPSAAEVEKDGLALGETERLLTIKVEELTLYILELKKEIDTLKEQIKE